MRMLRWMYGVSRLDRIRNQYRTGSLGVTEIANNMIENGLV